MAAAPAQRQREDAQRLYLGRFMATLTEPQKMFVVQLVARFQSPEQVVSAVQEEFATPVTRSQVQCYDPTKVSGRRLSTKWRVIFEATRKAYLEDVATIPLAHRGYRLQQLQELYDRAKSMGRGGNVPLAQSILIEAEKITGEVYTNRQKVEHSGEIKGGVLVVPSAVSADEWTQVAKRQQVAVSSGAGNGNGNGHSPNGHR